MHLNKVFKKLVIWFIRKIKQINPFNWDWTLFKYLDKDDELFNV